MALFTVAVAATVLAQLAEHVVGVGGRTDVWGPNGLDATLTLWALSHVSATAGAILSVIASAKQLRRARDAVAK